LDKSDLPSAIGNGSTDAAPVIQGENDRGISDDEGATSRFAFTIGHKLKVCVSDPAVLLGAKLLPGDNGKGDFWFKVWSNDDWEYSLTNTDFTGDDKGVNDEDANEITYPDGVTAEDWIDGDAKYDDDEGAPFTIGADFLDIKVGGVPYVKGTWIDNNPPTGDAGVKKNVQLKTDKISYEDHPGYYKGTLTLDVRQY
jgi:hypothetical protein